MSEFSSILAVKALDGLFVRQLATAQNIANANSPHFNAVRVTFEKTLLAAAKCGMESVSKMQPEMTTDSTHNKLGDEMRVDLELQTASATAMRYNALIDVLNRQMQLERIAVTGA